jgi:hypothetical protein
MKNDSNKEAKKAEQQKNTNEANQNNNLKKATDKKDVSGRLYEIYRALHRHTVLA